MKAQDNSINWFEISVADINRAKKFYETLFGIQMHQTEMNGQQMAFFPAEDMNGKVSGALAQGPMHKPSQDGAKIYLNANPDLSTALGNVAKAGGKVVLEKTKVTDEIGYIAIFVDSEGNGIALHSKN
jgi:uncharacterized protein